MGEPEKFGLPSDDEPTLERPRRISRAAPMLIGAAVLVFVAAGVAGAGSGGGFLASLSRTMTLMKTTFGGRELTLELKPDSGADAGEEAALAAAPACNLVSTTEPVQDRVVISEVAWMGTALGAQKEWIEFANISDATASIGNWQLMNSGKVHVTFPPEATIPPNGFLLLARANALPGVTPEATYSGSLRNSGETLTLLDDDCNVADAVLASPKWPAGDNASKRTMERNLATLEWYTSALPGGTPGKPNSDVLGTQSIAGAATSAPPGSADGGVVPRYSRLGTSTATSTTGAPAAASLPAPTAPHCSAVGAPTHDVLINEVGWAGTGAQKTADEWIEIWNRRPDTLSLAGWQLVSGGEAIRVVFEAGESVAHNGLFLLERTDDATLPAVTAGKIFSGSIKNSNETLRLFDASCVLEDEVVAVPEWPAGTASPDYRSAERNPDDLGWHTFAWNPIDGIYGTPGRVNEPAGPVPYSGTLEGESTSTATSTPTSTPPVVPLAVRVLISEVMAGSDGNASNEFVEIYNAGSAAVDLTGWTLKKKSSTGSESSLVVASRFEGRTITPNGYLLLANATGYAGPPAADIAWPGSYTLAYTQNSVALYDSASAKADEVSWVEIPAGKSYARTSWDNPTFTVLDIPTPQGNQVFQGLTSQIQNRHNKSG